MLVLGKEGTFMSKETTESVDKSRSRSTSTKLSIPGLEGLLEALTKHTSFLQFEDAQEAHDALASAFKQELVGDEGEGLRQDLEDDTMEILNRASRIFASLRPSNGGISTMVGGDGVTYSEEANGDVEEIHRALCWELVDEDGYLEDLDSDDFDFLESVAAILKRIRG